MPEKKSRRGESWTRAELKHLGRVPDSVLARRSGRTIKEIVAMRESRRIAMETGSRRWTASEIKMLGRYFDAELARRLRRPVHQKGVGDDYWRTFTPPPRGSGRRRR